MRCILQWIELAKEESLHSQFEEAEEKFLKNLELTVFINRASVENGEVPEYSSPLWDKVDD